MIWRIVAGILIGLALWVLFVQPGIEQLTR